MDEDEPVSKEELSEFNRYQWNKDRKRAEKKKKRDKEKKARKRAERESQIVLGRPPSPELQRLLEEERALEEANERLVKEREEKKVREREIEEEINEQELITKRDNARKRKIEEGRERGGDTQDKKGESVRLKLQLQLQQQQDKEQPTPITVTVKKRRGMRKSTIRKQSSIASLDE